MKERKLPKGIEKTRDLIIMGATGVGQLAGAGVAIGGGIEVVKNMDSIYTPGYLQILGGLILIGVSAYAHLTYAKTMKRRRKEVGI